MARGMPPRGARVKVEFGSPAPVGSGEGGNTPARSVLALGRVATDQQSDDAEAEERKVGRFIHLRSDRLRKRSGGRGGEDQD
ncbi:hypothetical protein [Novosphingobium cyanobacteriorum]|uniref:Uncharacterized protein n=1 Tax=Novosphingobium cyanobacteriorum TaxID=3024215 RepID=A0ABT6CFC6_9SPHN|nr:hypothetical protein [Novosphingobium cyanobacteriorum]MDF8332623.1 hypothetical protein [Novosphingobium cyanobacteriorum]